MNFGHGEEKRPRILIYRNDLLERSETFIAAQASALRRYSAVYCGLRKRSNGCLPKDAAATILGQETGQFARMQRLAYLQSGFAPRWHNEVSRQEARLVHAHFALDGACALPLVKRLQIPLLVTLHGYDVTSTESAFRRSQGGRIYLRRRAELFETTHTFLCVSEFIRTRAIEAGFPPEKLWVHSIGIDLDSFQPPKRSAHERNDSTPLILFVGRLVEKKGCIHLLRAMRLVQERCRHARVVVVGDGPLRPELGSAAKDIGLAHCTFLGTQPAQEVRNWLARATIFSVPSITARNGDAEGLGMVFCEAQAMGVPVVSFASGGVCEAVAHGRSGFLVAERNEPALAEAILALLEDEALRQSVSDHGRARMMQSFDLHKQTAILEAKYDELSGRVDRSGLSQRSQQEQPRPLSPPLEVAC